MTRPLRIIFAGTPDFSVPPLQALLDSPHQVIAVLTQPDRPAGRGRKLSPSPVKQLAVEQGVEVLQPLTLRDEAIQAQIAELDADLMVVVAYGLILPGEVLEVPRLGCLNIHASLLPRWRGAAPIQRAILAGDDETGVAIMQMEAGLDTGPVWHLRRIAIGEKETGGELHDRLSELGATALMETLPMLESGEASPVVQPDDGVVYADKLSKEEGEIDWAMPAQVISRKVRAFNPWPVAWTGYNGNKLRVWQGHERECDAEGVAGEVIAADKNGIVVQCGSGQLVIERLQLPGKRAMSAADFLNAHNILGARFE
ncbi:methionyl-tRNA formyltransferase [Solemya velum gill symbiont]|uniref:Methionyl-tRNA formyltransferase n=1 Tax=Solemya velum gill symbiont TaxID=2340 RepID=A0A1T2CN46_SOVGS|nr:methionyl-tRNA formyltransferase [Solemya velum gill symbiont]OOY36144.1 methionyl-tRNA formyltransferase [Solemya velum gill symbiont]OOY38150.1 methionyl-tRNA formyltransferase [Solemya velum gill symbiont]OOY41642.1 methionyl-tRNA formyltransferase [Solemya velum gill symbiont]OOY44977.1 methionyl-tRNA formyltransferase [Solemya velum gill symbiont]OOY48723.1 methionyl-tRNA formyltransferase [Solemya velum gill symbiont]